jgi:TonB-like protein
MMIEPQMPIPVQLVFEQPPPPPTAQPQQQPKPPQMEVPPRGPLSSVDQGAIKQADLGRSDDPMSLPSAGQMQQSPSQAQTATAVVPPVPQPKPTPPREDQPAVHPPKPSGAQVAHHDDTPREAPHSARYAGSAASRDEYLAYLVTLTRQHIDLLPMSVVGDRHGETVISVVVYDDGRLGPIGVMHGSGYPDIDERIEKMVAAVGHFPPLPQWYQGHAVQLELTFKFPEALEQTH